MNCSSVYGLIQAVETATQRIGKALNKASSITLPRILLVKDLRIVVERLYMVLPPALPWALPQALPGLTQCAESGALSHPDKKLNSGYSTDRKKL